MAPDALKISISIVSHDQAAMVAAVLIDIERLCSRHIFEVIVTANLPETFPIDLASFSFPVLLHENTIPKGFSANHNQAFGMASGDFFCVMNPDIRIHENPFPVLLEGFFDASIGVVAPMVVGPDGAIEDSARKFPSPFKILLKALGQKPPQDYEMVGEFVQPEWVGGMFMLFKRTAFAKLQGFDQRYFLYYEDVDICARVHLSNHKVLLCLNAKVTHNAQRSSHRSFKFLRWHIFSMLRFFLSDVYWRVQLGKLRGLSKN